MYKEKLTTYIVGIMSRKIDILQIRVNFAAHQFHI